MRHASLFFFPLPHCFFLETKRSHHPVWPHCVAEDREGLVFFSPPLQCQEYDTQVHPAYHMQSWGLGYSRQAICCLSCTPSSPVCHLFPTPRICWHFPQIACLLVLDRVSSVSPEWPETWVPPPNFGTPNVDHHAHIPLFFATQLDYRLLCEGCPCPLLAAVLECLALHIILSHMYHFQLKLSFLC